MRSVSGPELITLANQSRSYRARVKVANGSGTMIDLSSRFNAAKISHDIDQPVSGATVSFVRAQGSTQSLAPLRTDSTLNVNDVGAYAPLLDLNRRITIEVATTAIGATILAADYKMLFDGTIDMLNVERNPVVCECRDKGAPLVDRWIETEAFYSTTPVGTPIEDVMQELIDDVFGAAVHVLYVPVSPGFDIVKYRQQRMSVMDALVDLVQLIGWDVRYKWDDGTSAFRLTLSEPPRAKVTPDFTFGPNAYIDIGQLSLELTNIRNVVAVSFRDSANQGNRNTYTTSDGPSITKYGRRFFLMQEADTSPIDTTAEATTMATAALADLKDPKAEQEKNAPLFWPADISDLYRYSPNGVHYNTAQDWAVVEFDHEIAPDHMRTNFKVRGGPAGQYNSWLGRGGTMGGGGVNSVVSPIPRYEALNTEATAPTWDYRFTSTQGSGGGGANLTYTVKAKSASGSESTLSSGNESAFPLTLGIVRDPRMDKVITFTVKDEATQIIVSTGFTLPAYQIELTLFKPSAGDPDTLDSVADGATYKRPAGISASHLTTTASYTDGSVTPAKTQDRFRGKLALTADESIADATATEIPWDSAVYNVGSITSSVGITIPTGGDTGTWVFTAQIQWGANATGFRAVSITKNGTVVATAISVPLGGTVGTVMQVTHHESSPTVGDDFAVQVHQTSGGSLSVKSNFPAMDASHFAGLHLW